MRNEREILDFILQALRYQSRASYALMGGIAVTLGYVVACDRM